MSCRELLWIVGLIPLLHGCMGLSGPGDPSIKFAKRAPSPKVENGTAHDRAVFDLNAATKVILPSEATIRRGGQPGKVELLMSKHLGFCGHPPEPMSIRETRKGMGCAIRREGITVVVAIHGEWDSGIEGGAQVNLVAIVPEGVEVEQRAGLSKPVDAKRVWSGLSLPAEGWSAVPDKPNPDWEKSK